MKDIRQQTFGRLTALEPVDSSHGHKKWRCKCLCGNECVITGNALRTGRTQSCGCFKTERAKERRGPLHPNWKTIRIAHTKICQACQLPKSSDCFARMKRSPDGRAYSCKSCCALQHRQWWSLLPQDQKDLLNFRSKLAKYKLSPEEYAELIHKQNGVCAICENPETHSNWSLSIDHNHKTRKVRGLLCTQCNHILGKAKDNPSVLRAAAAYLESHASLR